MIQALTAPLLAEEKLLLYAAGVARLATGDVAGAFSLLDAVGPRGRSPSISKVSLPALNKLIQLPWLVPVVQQVETVSKFENDIFISYAHIDNLPVIEGQQEWVSDFHNALKTLLGYLRGETPKIWRDLKLQGNDYFGDTIVEQFPKVKLLVSILSPGYVRSEWCVKELREFCKAAEQTGGVRVADKSRIFKVIKTPVSRDNQPQEIQGLLGYEFYEFDQAGRPHEFSKIFGPDVEKKFLKKLSEFAYDVHLLLEKIANNGTGPVPPTGTTIYLAETTGDLVSERKKIKWELQQRGYIVLPDQPLPYTPDFSKVVRENLERCKLSIHLIGASYGIVPEGTDRSVVVLQNELAAHHSRECPEFLRLVWMPLGLQAQEPRQKELLQSLQNDPNLLQTTLEELKTIIQDKLNPPQQPAEVVVTQDGPVRVYLICDQRDREAIAPVKQYLYDQKFEVILPLFEGDEGEVRQYHEDHLRFCDVVIIYCGNVTEQWLQVKLGELRKFAVCNRLKPMRAKAIYMGEPQTEQKQQWCRTREAELIKNFNELELSVAQIIRGGQR